MKKFLLLFIIFFAIPLLFVKSSYAKSSVHSNIYINKKNVTIRSPVSGDFIFEGENLSIFSTISQDLIAAGENINVYSNVTNNAYLTGDNITILKNIGENTIIAGNNITIGKNSIISGNLIVFGNRLIVKGSIKGNVNVYVSNFKFYGKILGNINIYSGQINVYKNAFVKGNLTYTVLGAKSVIPKSSIKGKIYNIHSKLYNYYIVGKILFAIFDFIIFLIFSLLFIRFLPKTSLNIVSNVFDKFLKSLLYGIGVLVITPIFIIVLFITVLGIPISIFLLMIYFLFIFLSIMLGGVLTGSFISKYLYKTEIVVNWRTVLSGVLVGTVINLIPGINLLYDIFVFVLIFGSLFIIIKEKHLG